MKLRFVLAVCLLTLLATLAQAANTFDITLEGPWILYPYSNAALGNGVPVLVAVAPGVSGIFHSPNLYTGYGYYLKPGVYCLLFGQVCAYDTKVKTFTPSSDYYAGAFVPVFSKDKQPWDFLKAVGTKHFAVILPMPDNYRSDDVWRERFAPKYDPDGKGYGLGANKDNDYNIRTQLHYGNGPANFDLKTCDSTFNCTGPVKITGGHSTLKNTGNLHLEMKAPDWDDYCDPHVRSLYHPMLYLLDDTPFSSTASKKNVNLQNGFIDPARTIKEDGTGDYDDTDCLSQEEDDQSQDTPKDNQDTFIRQQSMRPSHDMKGSLSIASIVDGLAALESKEHKFDDTTFFRQIVSVHDALESNTAFRERDFLQYAGLLRLAADEARLRHLHPTADQLSLYANALGTKNGADCRAAIMLVNN
jgi:hypothetical protein